MRNFVLFFLLVILSGSAWADDLSRTVQQRLKDEGFYYGEVDGHSGAEMTAAIRRYQIRRGLKVTGQLSDETLRSLGISGTNSPSTVERGDRANGSVDGSDAKPDYRRNLNPDYRGNTNPDYQGNVNPGYRGNPSTDFRGNANPDYRENGNPDAPYFPPANRLYPPPNQYAERDYDGFRRPYDTSIRVFTSRRGLFAGTVYEHAPVDVQESVLFAVQGELSKAGFYRAPITGEPGPATTDAIVHFQESQDLVVSGRLDSETLNELRALPGQRNGPPAGTYRGIPERVYRGIPVQ